MKAKRSIRRTASEWRQVLARQKESGQSGVEFCRSNGIGLKGFYRAKSKYGKTPVENSFVKVTVPRREPGNGQRDADSFTAGSDRTESRYISKLGSGIIQGVIVMKWLCDAAQVYLHRDYVDFRKAINGLVSIIESEMQLSPFDDSVFVFCNRGRDKLKVIHWDRTGFVLWYKRLEESKYIWPKRHDEAVIELSNEQLQWLLSGYDLSKIQGHRELRYGP